MCVHAVYQHSAAMFAHVCKLPTLRCRVANMVLRPIGNLRAEVVAGPDSSVGTGRVVLCLDLNLRCEVATGPDSSVGTGRGEVVGEDLSLRGDVVAGPDSSVGTGRGVLCLDSSGVGVSAVSVSARRTHRFDRLALSGAFSAWKDMHYRSPKSFCERSRRWRDRKGRYCRAPSPAPAR